MGDYQPLSDLRRPYKLSRHILNLSNVDKWRNVLDALLASYGEDREAATKAIQERRGLKWKKSTPNSWPRWRKGVEWNEETFNLRHFAPNDLVWAVCELAAERRVTPKGVRGFSASSDASAYMRLLKPDGRLIADIVESPPYADLMEQALCLAAAYLYVNTPGARDALRHTAWALIQAQGGTEHLGRGLVECYDQLASSAQGVRDVFAEEWPDAVEHTEGVGGCDLSWYEFLDTDRPDDDEEAEHTHGQQWAEPLEGPRDDARILEALRRGNRMRYRPCAEMHPD